jgi:RNA recognition motif-containing protein
MSCKIHVANLGVTVDDRELENLFSRYGIVCHAQVVRFPTSGHSTSTGLVEMSLEREALTAIAKLHGRDHGGRSLTVRRATFRNEADANHASMPDRSTSHPDTGKHARGAQRARVSDGRGASIRRGGTGLFIPDDG